MLLSASGRVHSVCIWVSLFIIGAQVKINKLSLWSVCPILNTRAHTHTRTCLLMCSEWFVISLGWGCQGEWGRWKVDGKEIHVSPFYPLAFWNFPFGRAVVHVAQLLRLIAAKAPGLIPHVPIFFCYTVKNNILQFLSHFCHIFCHVLAGNEALNALVTSKAKLVRAIFWTLRPIGQKGKKFSLLRLSVCHWFHFNFKLPTQGLMTSPCQSVDVAAAAWNVY